MKRVLVTGGSGFIGRETTSPLLRRDFEVHLVQRSRPATLLNPIAGGAPVCHQLDLLEGDLEGLIRRIKPTHLLHLAWCVEQPAFWSSPANLDWVAASLRLLRLFALHGGARAVVAGTCAEYDWRHSTLRETSTPLAPRTLYGQAKASLFEISRAAAPHLGISLGWGRIFFPYGPFDRPGRLVSAAIDHLSAGEALECTDGEQARPFIFVEDVGEALVALLDSTAEGAVNIATREVVPVRQIVSTIAEMLESDDLVRFGAIASRSDEPPLLSADVRRLYREVGFKPRFNIRAGIAKTIAERLSTAVVVGGRASDRSAPTRQIG